MIDNNLLPKDEILRLLDFIFEDAKGLYKKVAPKGWKDSEFVHFFHPTAEQQFVEHKQLSENIKGLFGKEKPETKATSEEEFVQGSLEDINAYNEFLYILGLCVYDIFSMNHEVMREDGQIYDLGSFRGTGGFLADYFNSDAIETTEKYTYTDFYMGSIFIESRADLLPFYIFIFDKLKQKNCNWSYAFPELSVIEFGNQDVKQVTETPEEYRPEIALSKEQEANERKRIFNDLREDIEKSNKESFEEAKYRPVPKIVQAYKIIFASLPDGHPQKRIE